MAAMVEREVEARGGWFKLPDISTSWGCPFASTTTTDVHPKVSNRDSGFWGSFPLPSLPIFPPSIWRTLLRASYPSPIALLALHLVHRPREPPAAVLRFTLARFRTLGGMALETQFRNLHICHPWRARSRVGSLTFWRYSRRDASV